MKDTTISENIIYIGVDDKTIDLFESQYIVPNGVSYNSYLIKDDKIAIMDTVDARATDEWFDNLDKALDGRTPDYLVVLHMEPDHAANIAKAAEKYPQMQIVANAKTFPMMKQFFGTDFAGRNVTVAEGDTPRQPHIDICHGSDGTLAGGYGRIRIHRKDPVFRRRVRQVRCARYRGGLDL